MYKRLLICTDGSRVARRAVRDGIALAAALGASAVVLLVTPPFEPPAGYESSPLARQIEDHQRASLRMAERTLGAAARVAAQFGVRCRTLHVGRYPPAQTIVDTADAQRCDLIVMGSHGHGALGQLFLGSVVTRVASTCTVPVLVVRGRNATSRPRRATRKSVAGAGRASPNR